MFPIPTKPDPSAFPDAKAYRAAVWREALNHRRLVVWAAKRYRDRGVPFKDLVGEGLLTLYRAVQLYNPSLASWPTYAVRAVRSRLDDVIAEQGRPLHLPRWVRRAARKGHSGALTPVRRECIDAARVVLDAEIRTGRDRFDGDPYEGESPGGELPSVEGPLDDRWPGVAAVLGRLSERDRSIVRSYYGIGCEPRIQSEIGATFGLSISSIQKRRERALMAMRRRLGVT